jgi:2'-5' RNA ligase
MPARTRTFIALTVPEKVGDKVTHLQTLLAPEIPGVRWAATSFHVTLAFLGDVADADLNGVCRAAAEAAAAVAPFVLRVEGLGCFPDPKRARVVWVGMTGPGLDPLSVLQKRVVKAVAEAGCPPEDDRFHPHITLGRIKLGRGPARDWTPLLRHYQAWSAGSFDVAEVTVYASHLTPDGPVYTPLSTARLAGQNPGVSA